jgi:tetratricopeptide (TPR) repeat protein
MDKQSSNPKGAFGIDPPTDNLKALQSATNPADGRTHFEPPTGVWQNPPVTDDLPDGRVASAEAPTIVPTTDEHRSAPFIGSIPAPSGYEIVGELGRGGMGVVYKARQVRLNRLVALKMLLAGPHAGSHEVIRFRREAEAAACLQHPNIVQIYEVGEADGRPYLALEFVEGGSLAAKLDGTPQPPRSAARFVETLAHAVNAAQCQGIIHRDLKPANVLLGSTTPGLSLPDESWLLAAVPKISDFGLAKRLGDAAGPTHSGAVLGTPSYMAPEQAAGKGKETGPATDVYALGAILYELLTGRPPFKAATALDTAMQVITDDPVPPRRLQPKLPRDLETICLKCLQKDPRRRYPNADALAEDLRRFAADEPIHARPAGRVEVAVKWARRRPATAALIAVSLGAVIALFVLGLVYQIRLERSNTRLAEALDSVTEEHDRAQAHLSKALEVVDHMLTHVWDEPLGNSPSVLAMRKRLLQDASDYYQWNLARDDPDPTARRETARACFRMAGLHLWLGDSVHAESYGKQAIELQTRLVAEFPNTLEYRHDLSKTYTYLGHTYAMSQQSDRALEAYGKSLSMAEKLLGERSDSTDFRESLARSNLDLALFNSFFNPEAAERHCREAIALSKLLFRDHPENTDYPCLLAGGYGALAMVKSARNHPLEAEQQVREGLALLLPQGREPPRAGRDYFGALAGLKFYEGLIYHRRRQLVQAEASLKEGIEGFEKLVEHSPIFPYRLQLAMAYPVLGQMYEDTGRHKESEATHRKARDATEQLARDFPSATFLKTIATDRKVLLMVYPARRGEDIPKLISQAEALARQKDLSLLSCYNLACFYALASASTPAVSSAADQYARKAMELLGRAEAGNFFKEGIWQFQNLLATDSDLNALRQREDFKALLKRQQDTSKESKPGGVAR